MIRQLLAISLTLGLPPIFAEEVIPIWPDGAPVENAPPGAEEVKPSGNVTNVSEAQLLLHRPEKPNGTAVLIVPGGGYGSVCVKTEGADILQHLLPRGITAGILKYRLPYGQHAIPGDDARRAMQILRSRAGEFGIDPARIGVWGFSAGGHLAATLTNHGGNGDAEAADPLARISARPDFTILFYPVISMEDGVTHGGSRKRLLGDDPSAELIARYSLETVVTAEHPPTFLLHAGDDAAVPLPNSLRYATALFEKKVPVAVHAYTQGSHGPGAFGKNPSWAAAFEAWLENYALK